MILNGTLNPVARGGNVVESRFSIKETGKAFKILSDGLYSDKILAIVRELCCNAYDSHVAAGKTDVPFEVHLPTYFEPYFSVKDHGIGLTVKQASGGYEDRVVDAGTFNPDGSIVENAYTVREFVGGVFNTYFESSKTESNDFIGALGLGSKSPFSYVDSFTVISRKDGEQYSFSAFINEYDEPAIALLDTQPTSECNGVEITMPVRQADFSTFTDRARKVLEWFTPTPIINDSSFVPTSRNYVMSGSNWRLIGSTNYWNASKAIAVMGKIGYPLDAYTLQNELSPEHRVLINEGFVIDFPNGALEFSASRESLSYKPHTVAAIKEALTTIMTELPVNTQKAFDACETEWDAKALYRTSVAENSLFRNMYGVFKFTFKGQPLVSSNLTLDHSVYPDALVTRFGSTGSASRKVLNKENGSSFIEAGKNAKIIIDDLTRGSFTRCRQLAKSDSSITVWSFKSADAAHIDLLKEQLLGAEFLLASELPKVVNPRLAKTDVQTYNGNYDRFNDVDPEEFEEMAEDGGFYLPTLRGKPIDDTVKGDRIGHLYRIIRLATELKLIDSDVVIYASPRHKLQHFKENDKWVHFMDHLRIEFAKFVAKQKDAGTQALVESYNTWNHQHYYACAFLGRGGELLDKLGADHDVNVFRSHAAQVNINANLSHAEELAPYLQTSIAAMLVGTPYDFTVKWNELITKYPLLDVVNRTSHINNQHIADYLALVDASKH